MNFVAKALCLPVNVAPRASSLFSSPGICFFGGQTAALGCFSPLVVELWFKIPCLLRPNRVWSRSGSLSLNRFTCVTSWAPSILVVWTNKCWRQNAEAGPSHPPNHISFNIYYRIKVGVQMKNVFLSNFIDKKVSPGRPVVSIATGV